MALAVRHACGHPRPGRRVQWRVVHGHRSTATVVRVPPGGCRCLAPRLQISELLAGPVEDKLRGSRTTAPGTSIHTAQAEMNTIAARLAAAYPLSNQGRGAMVASLEEKLVARLRPSVMALAGAVGFVWLIGCANVTGLALTRGCGHGRDTQSARPSNAARFRGDSRTRFPFGRGP